MSQDKVVPLGQLCYQIRGLCSSPQLTELTVLLSRNSVIDIQVFAINLHSKG